MTVSSKLGFVGYALESSHADQATSTYSVRLQVREDMIDISGLEQPMLPAGGSRQYMNEEEFFRRGPRRGTFKITLDLAGFGATTAGAISATDLWTLLGYAIGNVAVTSVGGALTAGTQNTTTLTSTNTTLAVGALLRVGVKGDTRADGQPAVTAGASSPYTLLTALPGSPTTADSVYAMAQIYPAETTPAISSTLRFILATGNQQRWARGCACTGVEFAFPDGGLPTVTTSWVAAEWDATAQTFPSATATAAKVPTPIAGGSMYNQAKGTTTRATDNARDVTFTVDQQIVPVIGTGGSTGFQTVVGYKRAKQCGTISYSVMAEAAATHTWLDYWQTSENTIVARHILYGFGCIDGKGGALYLPDAVPVENVPQQEDRDGLNYIRISFRGRTNTVTTNELTLSNWRLGLG